jgi:hypothetical protein
MLIGQWVGAALFSGQPGCVQDKAQKGWRLPVLFIFGQITTLRYFLTY